jgi:Zn-dependent peptidase ImmA (M78 family)
MGREFKQRVRGGSGGTMRKPRTAKSIRGEVNRILAEHRIEKPPVPVKEIAEALGARVRYAPYEGELAGMLVRREGHILLGVNSLHHPNRQRFTLAHECGHLCLHRKDVHIDRSFRNSLSSLAIDPDEIEANRFAAELLMPYEMIKKDLLAYDIDVENEKDIQELAKRYQVSVQAMTHRITNILEDILREHF